MQIIDTHCHLNFKDYKEDLDDVLQRSRDAGIVTFLVPGTSVITSKESIELSNKYSFIFSGVGIHPHDADIITNKDIDELRYMAINNDKVIAIGEIGLDYYKGYSDKENQKKLFIDCLTIAKELDLPVILHNRDADNDFFYIIKDFVSCGLKGVVHCFSSNIEFLEKILSLGLYVSFTGNITFPKADNLRDLIKTVPLNKFFLETDGPFLAPVPFRGKRNEPLYLKSIVETYANIKKLSVQDIARISTFNANNFFSLGLQEKEKIAYPIRDSLYLNITNRCTNKCTFCTRNDSNYVMGHKLKLSKEPTYNEIIKELIDVEKYKEIVFCGYGESTLRLNILKEISKYIKNKNKNIRLVTNGQGNLINKRSIAKELKGLIDIVSVSLNTYNEKDYNNLCCSVFKEKAYNSVLEFIIECKEQGIKVELSCLDFIGKEAVEKCRNIAKKLNVDFRLRYYNVVG